MGKHSGGKPTKEEKAQKIKNSITYQKTGTEMRRVGAPRHAGGKKK